MNKKCIQLNRENMEKIIYCLAFIFSFYTSFSQNNPKNFLGKKYIFDANEYVIACDFVGKSLLNQPGANAYRGMLFTVERITEEGSLVIKFSEWILPSRQKNTEKYERAILNRGLYNFSTIEGKSPKESTFGLDTIRYFLLSRSIFDKSCSEKEPLWTIDIGVLISPFKFRSNPFLFNQNYNLGTCLMVNRKVRKNFSIGAGLGLSVSQVILDDFSTNGAVQENTERPAVTPSLSLMGGYRRINIVLGIGWDFINRTSEIEKSWTYQGKTWFGVGLGYSLFNSSSTASSTTKVIEGM